MRREGGGERRSRKSVWKKIKEKRRGGKREEGERERERERERETVQ